ncbi:MAG: hypothetical protein ACO3NK_18745 [Prochlorotrichaceae cyanobacterium]|jgi:hypothetical protein
MFSSGATLPHRLLNLSAQDYLTLKSSDKLHLITCLKTEQWQAIQEFAANLAAER